MDLFIREDGPETPCKWTSYPEIYSKAAKQAFDEYREKHGEDVPIPRVKDLNAEYAEILARKKKNYTECRREKSQMQEYLMAQKIVETMLHDDRNRQADQQREEQEKSKKQR